MSLPKTLPGPSDDATDTFCEDPTPQFERRATVSLRVPMPRRSWALRERVTQELSTWLRDMALTVTRRDGDREWAWTVRRADVIVASGSHVDHRLAVVLAERAAEADLALREGGR